MARRAGRLAASGSDKPAEPVPADPALDDLPDEHRLRCIRGGHRKRGYTTPLINGAVEYAASRTAPAVESYPVDPGAGRIDLTMAFVGTRAMFENAGFEVAGSTEAIASKLPRLVMRRMI